MKKLRLKKIKWLAQGHTAIGREESYWEREKEETDREGELDSNLTASLVSQHLNKQLVLCPDKALPSIPFKISWQHMYVIKSKSKLVYIHLTLTVEHFFYILFSDLRELRIENHCFGLKKTPQMGPSGCSPLSSPWRIQCLYYNSTWSFHPAVYDCHALEY